MGVPCRTGFFVFKDHTLVPSDRRQQVDLALPLITDLAVHQLQVLQIRRLNHEHFGRIARSAYSREILSAPASIIVGKNVPWE